MHEARTRRDRLVFWRPRTHLVGLPEVHMNLLDPAKMSGNAFAPPSKKSFLRLPVKVDLGALLSEYRAISEDAWRVSHWDIHCSSSMVLLRGGTRGDKRDFTTAEVRNTPVLDRLPYLSRLLGEEGPFGQCTYAFFFRMKPMGVARPHVDDDPAWQRPYRLHIPVITNPGALLLAERRALHLPPGEVWTFDNQAMHAVVNGDAVRTHLIFDVAPNPKIETLLTGATWDPGEENLQEWARASAVTSNPVFAPLTSEPLTVTEKRAFDLPLDGFASRVTEKRWIGLLTGAPLEVGDVIFSVNGVEECVMARTATDYLHLRHQPGEVVRLGIVRDGDRRVVSLKLYRNFLPDPVRRTVWRALQAMR